MERHQQQQQQKVAPSLNSVLSHQSKQRESRHGGWSSRLGMFFCYDGCTFYSCLSCGVITLHVSSNTRVIGTLGPFLTIRLSTVSLPSPGCLDSVTVKFCALALHFHTICQLDLKFKYSKSTRQ